MAKRLRLIGQGTLHEPITDSPQAVAHSPTVAVLPSDGSLIATYSVGSEKDSDDITLAVRRSSDGGLSWSEAVTPFDRVIDGRRGSLKVGHITALTDRLICATMWIDREAFPGAPLFNPETEGCLPMSVFVTESFDDGDNWSPLRLVPVTDDVGPASLTCPILALTDGRLALSIESNKDYLDTAPWEQRVLYLWSSDQGQTWTAPVTVCADPSGQIANWDQRTAVAPDGRLASFTWTYDFLKHDYRNIHRRTSEDGGLTWSPPADIGITDQASVPAILPDGQVVLAWVDRFGTGSVRARLSESIDAPFLGETEVVVYDHQGSARAPIGGAAGSDASGTGEQLLEMGVWTYGTPFAVALPDGHILVVYYEGVPGAIGIRWARLAIEN